MITLSPLISDDRIEMLSSKCVANKIIVFSGNGNCTISTLSDLDGYVRS